MSGFFSSIKKATNGSTDGQSCSSVSQATSQMRFTIQPAPGDTGFTQWAAAMKMVAQLPGGIPPEFRKRLWLTLAGRHLATKRVNWQTVERTCFSEWSHPDDSELGVQIVKDLHRTGCSLFCGADGQENQALLKRVLLAYARWNKTVGYCQGFNMLAALILQVTEKSESDALKIMIYLIEGVLPDSYFAGGLRGLSADMAAFRELMRARLPRLARHLDALQGAASQDAGGGYEPPLTNVFTMQWFLTLFCNCLPQTTVLRVWDLILLEGNEILLRSALAIWQVLAERILSVRSADEFYCIMGVLTRELLEFGLVDGNSLIKAVVAIGPLSELKTLREHYLYNINPWGNGLPSTVDKQLKLYRPQSLALDIGALKKQYAKLKQRQRQAHIIFSAAVTRQPAPSSPVAMNHLLLGKNALMPAKRLGPPKGSIPPKRLAPGTLHWKDAPKQDMGCKSPCSSSSSDTELCDESDNSSSEDEEILQNSQFDNLPCDSDNVLMKKDNTSARVELENDKLVTLPTQTKEAEEVSDDNSLVKSCSDEDNFDFEQFLADRVRCLKVEEEEPDERIDFARRNSERALQIIQENSLILQRILQCQSRLTPSPPLPHILNEDNIKFSNALLSEKTKHDVSFELRKQLTKDENSVKGDIKAPEYGSKYSSILEKSKSLDEKYKALILNKSHIENNDSFAAADFQSVLVQDNSPIMSIISNDENLFKFNLCGTKKSNKDCLELSISDKAKFDDFINFRDMTTTETSEISDKINDIVETDLFNWTTDDVVSNKDCSESHDEYSMETLTHVEEPLKLDLINDLKTNSSEENKTHDSFKVKVDLTKINEDILEELTHCESYIATNTTDKPKPVNQEYIKDLIKQNNDALESVSLKKTMCSNQTSNNSIHPKYNIANRVSENSEFDENLLSRDSSSITVEVCEKNTSSFPRYEEYLKRMSEKNKTTESKLTTELPLSEIQFVEDLLDITNYKLKDLPAITEKSKSAPNYYPDLVEYSRSISSREICTLPDNSSTDVAPPSIGDTTYDSSSSFFNGSKSSMSSFSHSESITKIEATSFCNLHDIFKSKYSMEHDFIPNSNFTPDRISILNRMSSFEEGSKSSCDSTISKKEIPLLSQFDQPDLFVSSGTSEECWDLKDKELLDLEGKAQNQIHPLSPH